MAVPEVGAWARLLRRCLVEGIAKNRPAAIHFCMTSEIAWEWYRSFLEVLRTGSLSGAARSLGMTQPTVGRHIAALEQQWGQPLFVRTAQGLQPTQAAQDLRPDAEAMAHTAAALERRARSPVGALAGTVRISASEVWAVQVLPALLAPLTAQHPALQLELVASEAMDDLLHRQADIAVRMQRPTQEQLVALHVGAVELGLYAHQRYIERRGMPQSLAALTVPGHSSIGFDQVSPFVRSLMQRWPELARSHFTYRTDSASAAWALLQAGAGIGMCHVALAQPCAHLQRVLASQVSVALPVWLAMHEDLRRQPACQRVFQALAAGLKAYTAQSVVGQTAQAIGE